VGAFLALATAHFTNTTNVHRICIVCSIFYCIFFIKAYSFSEFWCFWLVYRKRIWPVNSV